MKNSDLVGWHRSRLACGEQLGRWRQRLEGEWIQRLRSSNNLRVWSKNSKGLKRRRLRFLPLTPKCLLNGFPSDYDLLLQYRNHGARAENGLGAAAGLRLRSDQPRTPAKERVSGCPEPHSENESEGAVGPFRRRKSYACGDRSSARPQGFAGCGRDGTTRLCLPKTLSDSSRVCFRPNVTMLHAVFSGATPPQDHRRSTGMLLVLWLVDRDDIFG